jgi:Citrate transporter
VTFQSWAAVAVFVTAYVLIATERIHRVAAALGGAAVMLLLGATDAEHAFYSPDSGIDWNVVFLLLGMMIIIAVLKHTGLFEYVAIWAAKRGRGRPFRVMVILVLITALASAALDNVTTVLLIAPVTFLVCDRLGVPVVPFLVRHVFCLGAPHLGAPVEKGVNVAAWLLARLPETRPAAEVLNLRSVGVKDLRFGSLVEQDWQGVDADEFLRDRCGEVPFLDHATYYFVGATLTNRHDHPVAALVGDLLVQFPSAAGQGQRRRIPFAVEHGRHMPPPPPLRPAQPSGGVRAVAHLAIRPGRWRQQFPAVRRPAKRSASQAITVGTASPSAARWPPGCRFHCVVMPAAQ